MKLTDQEKEDIAEFDKLFAARVKAIEEGTGGQISKHLADKMSFGESGPIIEPALPGKDKNAA